LPGSSLLDCSPPRSASYYAVPRGTSEEAQPGVSVQVRFSGRPVEGRTLWKELLQILVALLEPLRRV